MAEEQASSASMEVSVEKEPKKDQKLPFFRKRKYYCCDTKLGCCCCCVSTPFILLFVFLLLAILSAWGQTFPATKFTNIKYEVDGVELHAYLATPKSPTNSTPAVVVFHAWNGMSEEATYFADRLAEDGYYAIAPDLFRGVAAEGTNIVWNILTVLTTSQNRMDNDSDAALSYLKGLTNVDDSRISSGPGFCFGGSQSLVFASRHKMAATVTCYGTYIKELHDADSSAWGKLKEGGPVQGIYGEQDTSPGPDDAKKFGEALQKNGMNYNISMYSDVGHGFITPEAHREDSEDPTHKQAVLAWNEIEQFLSRAFANVNRKRELMNRKNEDAIALFEEESSPPHIVPFHVSLQHRFECAYKCAKDHFTHTGHWHKQLLKLK